MNDQRNEDQTGGAVFAHPQDMGLQPTPSGGPALSAGPRYDAHQEAKRIRAQHGRRFEPAIQLMRFGRFKSLKGLVRLCGDMGGGLLGLELGSFQGESSLVFLETGAAARLLCVDSWDRDRYNADRIGTAERLFDSVAAAYPGRMGKLKAPTLEAMASLKELGMQFDFVYVDADHAEEAVRKDILAALPLIRRGGLLCGHDYGRKLHPGVTPAVHSTVGKPDHVYEDSSWVVVVGGGQ